MEWAELKPVAGGKGYSPGSRLLMVLTHGCGGSWSKMLGSSATLLWDRGQIT